MITRQNIPALKKLLQATVGLLQLCIKEFEEHPTRAMLVFGAAYAQIGIVMEAVCTGVEE